MGKLMNSKKLYVLMLTVFMIYGCNFHATDHNDENDKKEAEKVTGAIYFAGFKKDYKQIDTLFSDKFFIDIRRENLSEIVEKNSDSLGGLVTWDLKSWETEDISGENSGSRYLLQYDVEYKKAKTIETFYMEKEGDNIIRILKYNIRSDVYKQK